MAMYHRLHLGTRTIDFAVDETLQIDTAAVGIERRAVEIESEDVFPADQRGRHVACEQKVIGRLVVTHAHMPETVDDALVVENSIGNGEFFDQRGVGSLGNHDASPAE